MNTVNRTVMVLLLFLAMVGITVLCIFPHPILSGVGQWFIVWGEQLGGLNEWVRLLGGIVLAIILDAVLALLIFFEVRPQRKHFIRVQQVSGGMVTINDASIVQQLKYRLDPLSGVIGVQPDIRARGNKVQAVVRVEVTAGANVPELATTLVDKVQAVLTSDLGLQSYGKPEVRIKVAPAPGGVLPEPPPLPASTSRETRAAPPRELRPPALPVDKPSAGGADSSAGKIGA